MHFFADLTKNGFQIFIFDYSGFGYSEGKATRKNALEDAFSAFQFFKNLDEVKKSTGELGALQEELLQSQVQLDNTIAAIFDQTGGGR